MAFFTSNDGHHYLGLNWRRNNQRTSGHFIPLQPRQFELLSLVSSLLSILLMVAAFSTAVIFMLDYGSDTLWDVISVIAAIAFAATLIWVAAFFLLNRQFKITALKNQPLSFCKEQTVSMYLPFTLILGIFLLALDKLFPSISIFYMVFAALVLAVSSTLFGKRKRQ